MPTPLAPNHDLGHPDIDAQHREIWDLQGVAMAALRSGDHAESMVSVQALDEALRQHFDFEERLMLDASYPELALHEEGHRLFAADLARLRATLSAGGSHGATALWLESRIGSWLKLHVRTNDAALVRHLAAMPRPGLQPFALAGNASPR